MGVCVFQGTPPKWWLFFWFALQPPTQGVERLLRAWAAPGQKTIRGGPPGLLSKGGSPRPKTHPKKKAALKAGRTDFVDGKFPGQLAVAHRGRPVVSKSRDILGPFELQNANRESFARSSAWDSPEKGDWPKVSICCFWVQTG